MRYPYLITLIISIIFFFSCNEPKDNNNNNNIETIVNTEIEEKILGIEGEITNIEYVKDDIEYQPNEIEYMYSVEITLKTGEDLTICEDTSLLKSDILILCKLYKQNNILIMKFCDIADIQNDLNVYNNYKTGDKIIIRASYKSIDEYINNKTNLIQIFLIEKMQNN